MLIARGQNIQILSDGAAANEGQFPELWQDQQNIVLHIDVVEDDGVTPVTDLFNTTDTFFLAIAQDFDHATTVLTDTDDSGFNNLADRADLDVENGKLSVRLDGFRAELVAFFLTLADRREQTVDAQIKVRNMGEPNQKKVLSFRIVLKNVLERGGVGPAPPTDNFFTKGETISLIAVLEPIQTGTIDFKVAATHTLFTVPTDKAYIVDKISDRTDVISGGGVAHSYKVKTDAPLDISSVFLSASVAVDQISREDIQHDFIILPAGTIIQVEITNGSTFTTHDGRFILSGRLVDA